MNDKTELCGYPLPNIKNFVGNLQGSTIFSKLDLIKTFYNIPLTEESSKKSTVVTPWGAFCYKRLAMGLRNSAQSYQRLMDHILQGLPGTFCYIDDICFFSKTPQQHMETLKELFRRLESNGMAILLKKCTFGAPTVEYLG